MQQVNITELCKRLPGYLKRVRQGEEIQITSRGKVIARIVPEQDEAEQAKAMLKGLRKTAWVGDVVSPSGEIWDAEHDDHPGL